MKLVIFVQEPSMKETLDVLLPKLNINAGEVTIVTHQGKSDLDKSWRRKLPVWNTPETTFMILRDNDAGDCKALKERLLSVAKDCGKQDRVIVRIVIQELEAWFLGDREALVQAEYISATANPRELREPDSHQKPSKILSRWKRGRQKVSGARDIAQFMDPDNNCSPSFNHVITSLREFA